MPSKDSYLDAHSDCMELFQLDKTAGLWHLSIPPFAYSTTRRARSMASSPEVINLECRRRYVMYM